MKKITHIGIDVAKDKFDIYFDGLNKNHHPAVFDNTTIGIKAFHRFLVKNFAPSTLKLTMEVTGIYHLHLAEALFAHRYDVAVIHPFKIKKYAEMEMKRSKTDALDARIIAEYSKTQKRETYTPKSALSCELRQLLTTIDGILRSRTMLKNQLEALKHNPFKTPTAQKALEDMISGATAKVKEIEKKMEALVKKNCHDRYKNLISIRSVGKRLAMAIIAVFGEFETFETCKQASAYVGLNPVIKQSGKSRQEIGISKRGNSYLRKIIYMAALSAARWNTQCKRLYERLLKKGKLKKVATIAVANKLLRQIYAVVKYNRSYSESYA